MEILELGQVTFRRESCDLDGSLCADYSAVDLCYRDGELNGLLRRRCAFRPDTVFIRVYGEDFGARVLAYGGEDKLERVFSAVFTPAECREVRRVLRQLENEQ